MAKLSAHGVESGAARAPSPGDSLMPRKSNLRIAAGFTISVKPSPETERPAANDSAMPGLEPVEPTPPDLDLPKNQGAR